MKFCPNCGHPNDQVALYCESCGSVLDTDPSFSNMTERSSEQNRASFIPPPPPPPYKHLEQESHPSIPAESSYYTQPSVEYTPPSANSVGMEQGYWNEVMVESQYPKRTTGRLVINGLLYLWGVFSSAFGASGLLLQGSTSSIIGAVFLGYGFFGTLLLIPILILHKRIFLRSRMRILYIVGVSIAAGVLSLICAGILSGPQHQGALDVFLGIIFIIYGIATSILAVL